MNTETTIINRVAKSSLVTIDLADYRPKGERALLDIKDQLFQGMILKEKEYRLFLKEHDWNQYADKYVAITCSVDAIIPSWAYLLLGIKLAPYAKKVVFGNLDLLEKELYKIAINNINISLFKEKKVVIKGCSELAIPEQAYLDLVRRLVGVASSIMYGEPCSTVPLYKNRN